MQHKLLFKVLPSEAADPSVINSLIAASLSKKITDVTGYTITRQSIDARSKTAWINLELTAFTGEPFFIPALHSFHFDTVSLAKHKVIIVGAGPAGLFAALSFLEQGVKPIIIERGKDVRSRRRDLAILNKEGILNEESNYCFGEGGAGTYSDGKLYTRSNKRGNIERILQLFVHFGADPSILYQAHPHIGTNKLPQIITAMRQRITDCGGEFHFERKLVDFTIQKGLIHKIVTADGCAFEGDAVILATGHSARDIFHLFNRKKITIEAKPFALGVRIEHPQSIIDQVQYHSYERGEFLPPASYSMVQQVDNRGVFSFCMCPGGIIAPASTRDDELVVNGWSPSKRNNPFANSGIVVQVEIADVIETLGSRFVDASDPLLMMNFQQCIEQKAYTAGGGKFVAPAQRMVDFTKHKVSTNLPACSYLPGIHSTSLYEVLPTFISKRLSRAFISFGKKMKGYYTNEAVLVATESRTSTPVRIPRDRELLHHPQINNLYPCGEGAGYAGGIVSAAMDGERVAKGILKTLINK